MFDELYNLSRLSAAWAKLLLSEYGGTLSEAQRTDIQEVLPASAYLLKLIEEHREFLSMPQPSMSANKRFHELSHDIRTAISGVYAFPKGLLFFTPDGFNEYQRRQLTKIQDRAHFALENFIDWLNLSSVPVPTPTIPELFSLGDLIRKLVQSENGIGFLTKNEYNPDKIKLEIEDHLPLVYGKESSIEFLLERILSCFNYSQIEGITVSVQRVYVGTPHQRVEVRVSKPYDPSSNECSNPGWLKIPELFKEVLSGSSFTVEMLGKRRVWLQCDGMLTIIAQFETRPSQRRHNSDFNVPHRVLRVQDDASYSLICRYYNMVIQRKFYSHRLRTNFFK